MSKVRFPIVLAIFAAMPALGQYKMEPVATPAPAYAAVMQPQGFRIVPPAGGAFCEVWFRAAIPSGPKSDQPNVTFPTIQQGALLGVIRFPGTGADRRGQSIRPGVYTLRYSNYPVNGDHQGVAPQRDFVLLVPADDDKDPNATPAFDQLVDMSRKASRTPHPAVLSIEPPAGSEFPAFGQEGEKDWVLSIKAGSTPLSIILVGKAEG